jgi:hypothetical protein
MKFEKDRYDFLVGRIVRYSTIIEQMIAETAYQLDLIESVKDFMAEPRINEKCSELLIKDAEHENQVTKEQLDNFIEEYQKLLFNRHDLAHALITKPIDEENFFLINIRKEKGKAISDIKIRNISKLEDLLNDYDKLRLNFKRFIEKSILKKH